MAHNSPPSKPGDNELRSRKRFSHLDRNDRTGKHETEPGTAHSSVLHCHDKSECERDKVKQARTRFFVYLHFLVANTLSARYAILADCDEVFNYWEPMHYLSHGNGLQTWEYSPVYAIRSWLYIVLHAILSKPVTLMPLFNQKLVEFYTLRYILAALCAYCETRLYVALSARYNLLVANVFLVSMCTSTGMFHAATAFLPSSFAMYFVMLGMAFFEDLPQKPIHGVTCIALAGVLGWPFSVVVSAPYLVDIFGQFICRKDVFGLIIFITRSFVMTILILTITVTFDSAAYRKLTIVPLNIVWYNVFGGLGKGPNIFGTEVWYFYILNLLLNFNVYFAMALMYPLMFIRSLRGVRPWSFPISILFYLWFILMSFQPHKEERFMYVIYPALCVNAALTFDVLYKPALFEKYRTSKMMDTIFKTGLMFLVSIGSILSISRSFALVHSYSAPMHIYHALPAHGRGVVCIGKEWYRFPSSYFLPLEIRPRFIKSSFSGLLPGAFLETGNVSRPGTWATPAGMNDENREDPKKYVDVSQCDFMVDSYFPAVGENPLEPDYVLRHHEWTTLVCEDFLDSSRTPLLSRILFVPYSRVNYYRQWGKYCLLQRRIADT